MVWMRVERNGGRKGERQENCLISDYGLDNVKVFMAVLLRNAAKSVKISVSTVVTQGVSVVIGIAKDRCRVISSKGRIDGGIERRNGQTRGTEVFITFVELGNIETVVIFPDKDNVLNPVSSQFKHEIRPLRVR